MSQDAKANPLIIGAAEDNVLFVDFEGSGERQLERLFDSIPEDLEDALDHSF